MKYPLASVSWDQAEYQAAMKVLSGTFTLWENILKSLNLLIVIGQGQNTLFLQ